jgi:hypothetical protein
MRKPLGNLKGEMDYEDIKEQTVCGYITHLWVLTGTY